MSVPIPECQAGEWPVLRALLPADPVCYVDVGAGDYCDCSNTWQFYQAGGHGLLIEPNPQFYAGLIHNRFHDEIETCAAWDGYAPLQIRLAWGSSSIRKDWPIEGEMHQVPGQRLAAILRMHPDIRDRCDLCSIDVEGTELQVIAGANWQTFRPPVVIIEYVRDDPQSGLLIDVSAEWQSLLEAVGYRECCRSWLNKIFLRESEWHRWEAVQLQSAAMPHQSIEESWQHYEHTYGWKRPC